MQIGVWPVTSSVITQASTTITTILQQLEILPDLQVIVEMPTAAITARTILRVVLAFTIHLILLIIIIIIVKNS
jgi:hypothetical protein